MNREGENTLNCCNFFLAFLLPKCIEHKMTSVFIINFIKLVFFKLMTQLMFINSDFPI